MIKKKLKTYFFKIIWYILYLKSLQTCTVYFINNLNVGIFAQTSGGHTTLNAINKFLTYFATNANAENLAGHSRVGTARIHAGREDARKVRCRHVGQVLHRIWVTLATGHDGGLLHCLQER